MGSNALASDDAMKNMENKQYILVRAHTHTHFLIILNESVSIPSLLPAVGINAYCLIYNLSI